MASEDPFSLHLPRRPAAGAGGDPAARRAGLLGLARELQARLAAATPARAAASDDGSAVAIEPAPRCGFTDDLIDAAGGVVEQVGGAVGGAVEQVGGAVGGAVEQVGGAVEGVVEQVGGAVEGVVEQVGGAVEQVGGAVEGAVEQVGGAVEGAVEGGEAFAAQAGELLGGIDAILRRATDEQAQAWGPQVELLRRALVDLGRPVTVDLDGIEQTLHGLFAGFHPSELVNQAAPGGVTFVQGEVSRLAPPLSAASAYDFQDLWNSRGEGGVGSVRPSTPTLAIARKDSTGKILEATFTITWVHSVAAWAQYQANPGAFHPLERKGYEDARGTMVAHEDGHVAIDREYFTTANVANCVGMTRGEAITHVNGLVDRAQAGNDTYDSSTSHGLNQTATTSTRMRMPTKAEKDEYDEKAKPKALAPDQAASDGARPQE